MASNSKGSTPPYASAARISDSPCFPQYTASLKCLEEFSSNKSKCQEHFDVYKECKKKEHVIEINDFHSIDHQGHLVRTEKHSSCCGQFDKNPWAVHRREGFRQLEGSSIGT
ncbi:uncharacterized protein [Arachis hypogaea]|uniref:uncharacterized protein isoform X1 n=1 Tax=Arachis hypogaea TaxID=3818 RepID=UPI000A2C265F|nr:uncharacterized protein LOC112710022 isoform X1 [Arachis hypogaea]